MTKRPEEPPAKLNVIGYVRVSTEEQANSGLSLANQRLRIQAYAAASDIILTEIIEDAGKSAKTLERPGMQRVLHYIAGQETDGVVILKLDRLTRSVRDLGALIEALDNNGVALMSVQESINTATAAGRLVANLLGSVAQWECEVIGERTKSALAVKRMKGEKTGGTTPYGYTAYRKRLSEHPGEQANIAKMIELRATGMGYHAIAAALTGAGVFPRTGKTWHPQAIYRILARSNARWQGVEVEGD